MEMREFYLRISYLLISLDESEWVYESLPAHACAWTRWMRMRKKTIYVIFKEKVDAICKRLLIFMLSFVYFIFYFCNIFFGVLFRKQKFVRVINMKPSSQILRKMNKRKKMSSLAKFLERYLVDYGHSNANLYVTDICE